MEQRAGGRLSRLIVLAVLTATVAGLVPTPAQTRSVAQDTGIDADIIVRITSPRAGEEVTGSVVITGYAVDQRSPQGSGLNERDVQVWINDTSDPRNLLGYASPTPDVPGSLPPLPPGVTPTAFARVWNTCTMAPGTYELLVWVSSLARPGARNLASVDVTVGACPAAPNVVRPTAAQPTLAPAATAVPSAAPPNEFVDYDIRCSNFGGVRGEGHVCVTSATGPLNTVVGSNVEITMEMLVGQTVRVETFSCGPVDQARQVRCSFNTVGRIFQDHLILVIFILEDGRRHTVSGTGGCGLPTPGRVCP
jgi:hypothetical protein